MPVLQGPPLACERWRPMGCPPNTQADGQMAPPQRWRLGDMLVPTAAVVVSDPNGCPRHPRIPNKVPGWSVPTWHPETVPRDPRWQPMSIDPSRPHSPYPVRPAMRTFPHVLRPVPIVVRSCASARSVSSQNHPPPRARFGPKRRGIAEEAAISGHLEQNNLLPTARSARIAGLAGSSASRRGAPGPGLTTPRIGDRHTAG